MSDLTEKAERIAKQAHSTQRRKYGGALYHTHLQRVAYRVSQLPGTDEVDVAAAWLHDILEDTDYPMQAIEAEVGSVVVTILKELTNPSSAPEMRRKPRRERAAVDRNHLSNASLRAKRIKLVDLLQPR